MRYRGSLECIVTILSGMSAPEQLANNIRTTRNFESLAETDHTVLRQARDCLAAIPAIPRIDCKHCMESKKVQKGCKARERAPLPYIRHGREAERQCRKASLLLYVSRPDKNPRVFSGDDLSSFPLRLREPRFMRARVTRPSRSPPRQCAR